MLPRTSYSLSIEGDNVEKKLVKDGYTQLINIHNDYAYGFQDKYDSGTILAGSLLPVYQAGKRLGFEREQVSPFLFTFLDISDTFTLEELRQYKSMSEFVDKTGFMQSDEVCEDVSPGYITFLENTVLDRAKQFGFNDVDSYIADLCKKNEYEKCESVKETWYPVYYKISKELVSRELAKTVSESHNYTLLEKDNTYYIKASYSDAYLPYLDEFSRSQVPVLADELNVNVAQIGYSYEEDTREVYHTYYDFTEKQLIDAVAAEMDIWLGRWDFYLYGDEHFNYWYESERVNDPGYYYGNWGAGFGVIQDQMPVVFEPEYKYIITGPGRITINIKGREDQNGRGSVNLRGEGTIVVDVFSDLEGQWKWDSKGWWYQNPDGTYPVNTWKQIDGNGAWIA